MPRATKRNAIVQVLVCASGCCCGRTDKNKPAVPVQLLKSEWRARKLNPRVQLTVTECLGPCDQMNVVGILSDQAPVWLGGLVELWHFVALLDWATACHQSGVALPLPDALIEHRIARFPAAPVPVADHLFAPPPLELVP